MYSFLIALAVLIGGYFTYGVIVEKVFGANPKKQTPAYALRDGVDYVPMSTWRVFLVQFLNIAGLGPIFGPILGIMYGTSAYIWIAIGTIFGGAVHDYFSGMISLRSNGISIPEIIGKQLGLPIKQVMRVFALVTLLLLGAVFVINPAKLLFTLTGTVFGWGLTFWIIVIFVYYVLATLLPIDKLIGNLYPVFGFALLFMAVGLFVCLFTHSGSMPEFTDAGGLCNRQSGSPIFPVMFISIACGAISGFHSTQSPLMARCIKNEKYGRPVFYGAMVAEGIVALIWAAATITFFNKDYSALAVYLKGNEPAIFVNTICHDWLGTLGGILAVLGVIAAPITSGDTALRSARLIVADFLHYDQSKVLKRIIISVPIFALAFAIMQMNWEIMWRYFAWANQTLATFTLWAIAVYMVRECRKYTYLMSLIPAAFMTVVTITYIMFAKEGLQLDYNLSLAIAGVATVILLVLFARFLHKQSKQVLRDNVPV
ncbi:MAG: carbon starvation protein A [Muribaculaceae bacterium]|jgi:carbon starvation protein CstA|nr:carbon starvation protein A [Muribaculaceae bacterium]